MKSNLFIIVGVCLYNLFLVMTIITLTINHITEERTNKNKSMVINVFPTKV